MPHITLGNGGEEEIFYEYHDGGGEESLVLVHGSGGDHTHWPRQLRRLSGFRVYAPDLPGHGRSGGAGRRRVGDYAAVSEAFVARLGITGVTLFGHSLGGAGVQAIALEKRDWLSRVVLVGTGSRLRVAPAILSAIRTDYPGAVEEIVSWAYGPDAPGALVEEGRRQFLGVDPEIVFGDYSACDGFDITDRLGEISVPALVVSADKDRLTPIKYGRFLAEGIPLAELALIEEAGHMMTLERPDALVSCVCDFLKRR